MAEQVCIHRKNSTIIGLGSVEFETLKALLDTKFPVKLASDQVFIQQLS